jgi:hypothetical protein
MGGDGGTLSVKERTKCSYSSRERKGAPATYEITARHTPSN